MPTELVPIVSIIAICYMFSEIFKCVDKESKHSKMIPAFSMLCGAILGILSFFFAPDVINATNVFTACAVGIASGFAATGVNQTVRKTSQYADSKKNSNFDEVA